MGGFKIEEKGGSVVVSRGSESVAFRPATARQIAFYLAVATEDADSISASDFGLPGPAALTREQALYQAGMLFFKACLAQLSAANRAEAARLQVAVSE